MRGRLGWIIAATLCNRIGRKYTALLSCALYVPGIVLSFAAKYCHPAFELLFIGRLIWSVANGICIVNQTVWIVEAAPARHRGRMAAMQEVFMALGSLMTQALGVPFSTGELWPLMFVMPLFVNLISVCIFVFVHESPHYLLMNKKDPEK
uniref:Major facilitator superfamily (MFS) profile domain-containing protein n=1 Tax=Plectus sambesii TaxID=2011161 RepID=A0A914UXJ8_9BILA